MSREWIDYLDLVEPIKKAKRAGKNEEALDLCMIAIDLAEKQQMPGGPPPWYTTQAAIVLRKLGRVDEEIAVLERYLEHIPAEYHQGHRVGERLEKARQFRGETQP